MGYSKTDWIPSGTWCFIVSKLSKHGEVLGPKWNFQSPFKFLWSLIFAVEIQWFLYPLCTLLPLKPPRSSESLPNPLPKGFVLRERSGVRMFRGKKEKKGCQLIAPKCTFPPPNNLFVHQAVFHIHSFCSRKWPVRLFKQRVYKNRLYKPQWHWNTTFRKCSAHLSVETIGSQTRMTCRPSAAADRRKSKIFFQPNTV